MGIDLHLPLPDLPPNMAWGGMLEAYFANAEALAELAAAARSAGVSKQTVVEVVALLVVSAITYYRMYHQLPYPPDPAREPRLRPCPLQTEATEDEHVAPQGFSHEGQPASEPTASLPAILNHLYATLAAARLHASPTLPLPSLPSLAMDPLTSFPAKLLAEMQEKLAVVVKEGEEAEWAWLCLLLQRVLHKEDGTDGDRETGQTSLATRMLSAAMAQCRPFRWPGEGLGQGLGEGGREEGREGVKGKPVQSRFGWPIADTTTHDDVCDIDTEEAEAAAEAAAAAMAALAAASKAVPPPHFLSMGLPEEVQLEIVEYLQPRDVLRLTPCSRAARRLGEGEQVWRTKWAARFGPIWRSAPVQKAEMARKARRADGQRASAADGEKEGGCGHWRHFYSLFELEWAAWLCAGRNREESCWVGLEGGVYDLTAFLEIHPGSKETILVNAGGDATAFFQDVGHSAQARAMMADFCIVPPPPQGVGRTEACVLHSVKEALREGRAGIEGRKEGGKGGGRALMGRGGAAGAVSTLAAHLSEQAAMIMRRGGGAAVVEVGGGGGRRRPGRSIGMAFFTT
ncbi:hypothetical protein NSK_004644 [Nannochloropsis salina CCMP1776]|uniref:Cytochrome b5 heme-binding domain-containing protein n=1 Tax=Nannochloropsis salina CCMP1776 TaxID=1027361 RepID=A0A4D9CXV4_9STRA|nr:hypothetical protein NSK_004644 [Nannochloropsis salina CCMP1776]|eukprot:TFJ84172.1 hypothetical protein NSK_004644 [Nannochloropsis salina CCMP1776]